ncbi:MAG TPA: holo-[acyl-carrier-protein] synthase [Opitutae bacterium]|nr:holo-[acyl-carrier-protein] synthase [Opitutae bacterium]
MLAIGTDIIEIDRIRGAYERYGKLFLDRIFTEEEQAYALSKKNPFPSLAVRFAAKEAVAKAFGCGIGPELHWKSISIRTAPNGRPTVLLDPQAQALLTALGGTEVLISLSHTHVLAQAVALL